jgi:predicted site-specific integrase-resolvase
MTETPISAERAAKVLGVNRKTLLRMAAAGRLAGTWFVPTAEENGRKVFLESKLLEYRDRQIQSAASRTSASV